MSTRLSHDDLPSVSEMGADGARVGRRIGAAPSLAFEDQRQDRPKPVVEVSEAARRLAAAIYGD